jgi:hypothetical protein
MVAEASRQTWHNPTGEFLRYTPDAADIISWVTFVSDRKHSLLWRCLLQ